MSKLLRGGLEMKSWTIALVAAGALATGCGGDKSGASGAQTEKLGVQACDDYIAKMEACIAKSSGPEKVAIESGFKDTREAWKQSAAKGGAERDQLKIKCENALAAIDPRCK